MYLERESLAITRHFANFGSRQMHFRLAGSGPPILLIHQSPTSSAEMASQLEQLAKEFTVIAPDLPGYGLSDPLPVTEPDMEPFTDAVCALLDVLDVSETCVYGFHTGAMVAAELAARHPERLSAVIIDGLVVLEPEEYADIVANYFEHPAPRPDGGHLAFHWARIRDQLLFFPWYKKRRSARMMLDVPPAAALQPYVTDLLRCRSKMGYRAAFAYPTRERVRRWQVPVYLLNFQQDPIAAHPERIDSFPDVVRREVLEDPLAVAARATDIARQHPAAPVEVARASAGRCAKRVHRQIINTGCGPVHVLVAGSVTEGRPWAVILTP